MSTYVLMRILESAPSRYDLGIRLLTLGKLDKVYDRLVLNIQHGQKVLDIGCGTGALTCLAAQRGAQVTGIDINPHMLEIAQNRIERLDLTERVRFEEIGVAELGSKAPESFDIVMSGLCFSELSRNELEFTLREIKRILKPGGLILVVDEVTPKHVIKKSLNWLIKIPLLVITYLVTQTTIQPLRNFPEQIKKAGFRIENLVLNKTENLIELVAQKGEKE